MDIIIARLCGSLIGFLFVRQIFIRKIDSVFSLGIETPSQRNKRVKKMFEEVGLEVDLKVDYSMPEREELYVWVSTNYEGHSLSDCFPYVELDNSKVLAVCQAFEEEMAKYHYSDTHQCSECGAKGGSIKFGKSSTCGWIGTAFITNVNGTPLCGSCNK
jgi:hypothetical protein